MDFTVYTLKRILILGGLALGTVSVFGNTDSSSSCDSETSSCESSRSYASTSGDSDGHVTPLMQAAYGGDVFAVERYLKNNHPLTRRDEQGRTAFMWAVIGGDIDVIAYLWAMGGSVFDRDHDGLTPLMWAARKGFWEAARFLAVKKSPLSVKDHEGRTALVWAAGKGYGRIVRQLIHQESQNGDLNKDHILQAYTLARKKNYKKIANFLSGL